MIGSELRMTRDSMRPTAVLLLGLVALAGCSTSEAAEDTGDADADED